MIEKPLILKTGNEKYKDSLDELRRNSHVWIVSENSENIIILDKGRIESFDAVGSELVGIPQLAEPPFLRGAAISYVVRQMAIGAKVSFGRYYLRLDNILK